MKKTPIVLSACFVWVLASCKKDTVAPHAAKASTLTSYAACATPPVLMSVKTVGGPNFDAGHVINVDNAGNISIIGSFDNTVDFDPGPGVTYATIVSGSSDFTQRFSAAGKFLGVSTVKTLLDHFAPRDKNGNYYSLGLEGDPGLDGEDPVQTTAIKRDPAGNKLGKVMLDVFSNIDWLVRYIQIDGNDNIVINNAGNWYKYTTAGKLIWKKRLTANGCWFNLDKNGNIYAFTGKGLIKYDPDGNKLWEKTVIGSTRKITFDISGNMYIIGEFSRTIDFDPGPGSSILTCEAGIEGRATTYIQKLNASGNFLWAVTTAISRPYDIKLSPTGEYIYVTGEFWDTINLYTIAGKFTAKSKGKTDVFALAYRQCK